MLYHQCKYIRRSVNHLSKRDEQVKKPVSHPAPRLDHRWAQEWCWVVCFFAPAVSVLWILGTWCWNWGSPAAACPGQPKPEYSKNTSLCLLQCRKTEKMSVYWFLQVWAVRERERRKWNPNPEHGCKKRTTTQWELAHKLAEKGLPVSQKQQTLPA